MARFPLNKNNQTARDKAIINHEFYGNPREIYGAKPRTTRHAIRTFLNSMSNKERVGKSLTGVSRRKTNSLHEANRHGIYYRSLLINLFILKRERSHSIHNSLKKERAEARVHTCHRAWFPSDLYWDPCSLSFTSMSTWAPRAFDYSLSLCDEKSLSPFTLFPEVLIRCYGMSSFSASVSFHRHKRQLSQENHVSGIIRLDNKQVVEKSMRGFITADNLACYWALISCGICAREFIPSSHFALRSTWEN